MQSHKVIILIATLIAIELHCSLALSCAQTTGNNAACADGITQCYIKSDNDKISKGCYDTTITGCTSPSCLLCNTDNCNYLMCQTCTNCATLDKVNDTINILCDKPNMVCTIQADPISNEVSRGCYETCGTDEAYCYNCTTDNCNIGNMPLGCRVCRSDNYAPCRQALVGASRCMNNKTSKCFQGQWDDIVLRGCLEDAGEQINQQCLTASDTRCTTCDTFMCNNVKYNGAEMLKPMGLGLVLGLIYFFRHSA